MDNLTPITREEILMNDEPLTPITREEKILAGEDLNPVTRREYFLKKYRHAGGDVMVEELSVTENGTYTAPEGKAYSPVEVAVPLPDNAYLLKTASGSLVSFSDGADLPTPSFICNIDAVQDLHGYDSPWVGGAGKNKLPNEITNATEGGITFSTQPNGKIKISGTSTKSLYETDICENFSLPLGQYILSYDAVDGVSVQICNRAEDREYCAVRANAPSVTFTVDETKQNDMKVRFTIGSGVTVNGKTGVMIRLATETDPTFAPYSNICPISGHTGVDAWVRGKNLLDITTITIDGFTFIEDIDGYVSASPNNDDNRIWSYDKSQYKLIIPAGDWKLVIETKTPTSANSRGIIIRDSANNTIRELWADSYNSVGIKTINFTLTEKTNIGIMTKMYDAVARFMIVPQSASNDFEFYNFDSQTIQVSWQTEAGEVFGGYVDLVSGVLTVDRYCESFNGSENWEQESADNCYSIKLRGTLAKWERNTFGMCNLYQYNGTVSGASNMNNEGLYYWFNSTMLTPPNNRYAMIRDNTKSTLEEFKTYLSTNNLQVVYELATPQTYQLTPQQIKSLLGNNNAWCDTGNVDIDYFTQEVTG